MDHHIFCSYRSYVITHCVFCSDNQSFGILICFRDAICYITNRWLDHGSSYFLPPWRHQSLLIICFVLTIKAIVFIFSFFFYPWRHQSIPVLFWQNCSDIFVLNSSSLLCRQSHQSSMNACMISVNSPYLLCRWLLIVQYVYIKTR